MQEETEFSFSSAWRREDDALFSAYCKKERGKRL
jgi:hypothetical protein